MQGMEHHKRAPLAIPIYCNVITVTSHAQYWILLNTLHCSYCVFRGLGCCKASRFLEKINNLMFMPTDHSRPWWVRDVLCLDDHSL